MVGQRMASSPSASPIRRAKASAMALSVSSVMCGPCCSVLPTGTRATRADANAALASRQVMRASSGTGIPHVLGDIVGGALQGRCQLRQARHGKTRGGGAEAHRGSERVGEGNGDAAPALFILAVVDREAFIPYRGEFAQKPIGAGDGP